MPQPYLRPISELDILRQNQGGFRDDNFLLNWSGDAGVTPTTDGDILTLSGTTLGNGYHHAIPNLSSTTFAYIVVRAKIGSAASGTLDIVVNYNGGTTDNMRMSLSSNFTIFSQLLTSGRVINNLGFFNQSQSGTNLVDYVALCKLAPVTFTNNDVETGININRSTTAVNEASFSLRNDSGKYMTGTQILTLYDTVYTYHGYLQDDLVTKKLTKTFGGTINEIAPTISTSGDVMDVHCLGWAAALNNILIAQEYGSLSDNPSITSYPGIITDIINTYVNASGTTYQLTTNFVQSLTGPPAPTYLLFKNDDTFNAVKQCCDLHTAGDPTATTVYPVEFFVDNSENCHLVTIGSWATDPNPSTYPNALNVGREHITNNFAKNLHDLKNRVHFITAYINPPNRDAWTEGTASQWSFTQTGTGGTNTLSDDSTNFKVGTKSIHLNWTGESTGSTGILLRYPSANNLGLNVTQLGGKITPATLRFYVRANLPAKYTVNVLLDTGGSDTNQFIGPLLPKGNDSTGAQNTFKNDTTWNLIEQTIGPYGDALAIANNPVWTNVSQIIIQVQWPPTQATSGDVWIDGLYLEGQNHFVATDSTRIAQYGTRESSISSLKHRDASSERKLAKAELFRLHNAIIRGSIQVPGMADVIPGQLVTVTAQNANLSNSSLRVLSVKHSYTAAGFTTTLDLTDDVTNYQALQLTSMADLLLMQYVPKRVSQREREETGGQPVTLSGMQDPTTTVQVQDYPS